MRKWLTEARDACQKSSINRYIVVLRAGLVPGRRPFLAFFMSIFPADPRRGRCPPWRRRESAEGGFSGPARGSVLRRDGGVVAKFLG